VQLVNVSDGHVLWSSTYDRTLDDIFAVQDDIASRVVTEVRQELLGEEPNSAAAGRAQADVAAAVRGRAANPDAYDAYLQGRALLASSADGATRAQAKFREAIERAPSFALAYTGLGAAYVLQSWLSSRDRSETVSKARAALDRALALDDQLSEARALSGEIRMYFDHDWDGADRDFRAAVELSPGSDIAHRVRGSFLSAMGRHDEALESARRAQELDPLSVNATHELGYALLVVGRLEEAAREFRGALDLNPSWIWGNVKLGLTSAKMGDQEEALARVRRADELLAKTAATPLLQAWLAGIESTAGRPERARATLARLTADSRTTWIDPVVLAELHGFLGEHDAMVEQLEKGLATRSPLMAHLLQLPAISGEEVREHPGFGALATRMRFPAADAGGS